MSIIDNYNNITPGFIDLATFGEIEKQLYVKNPNFPDLYQGEWSTTIPTRLRPDEKDKNCFYFTIAGDWLENVFIYIQTEPILKMPKNYIHNIFEKIEIVIDNNDLVIWSINNIQLDFLANFMEKSKKEAYDKMINSFCLPLPLNSPIPLMAAPYNKLKLRFKFSDDVIPIVRPFATYRLITCENQKKEVVKHHKILLEQYSCSIRPFRCGENFYPCFDLHNHGAVKNIFFAFRQKGKKSEYIKNLIDTVSLTYEETARLHCMPAHFTSVVQPFLHYGVIGPEEIHMYSFGDMSTNFDKITNISLCLNIKKDTKEKDCELIIVTVSKSILDIHKGVVKLIL